MEHAHYINVTCLDISELTFAIDSLKAIKIPRPDNIQPELLKADRVVSTQLMFSLSERFLSDEGLPPQLTVGIITILT